jgi:hypothetical protein
MLTSLFLCALYSGLLFTIIKEEGGMDFKV